MAALGFDNQSTDAYEDVYTAATISSAAELVRLRSEWRALYARAPGKMAAQHPAYFDAARETAKPGTKLVVVTVHRGGELVGLWPLSLYTHHGCRAASHPSIGANDQSIAAEEYAGGMLLAPDVDQTQTIAAAIAEIRQSVDFMLAHNLYRQGPLIDELRHAATASVARSKITFVSQLRDAASWDSWLKSKSANFRQHLGRQRRGLAKLGALESVQDEPSIIPWFFHEKREWLKRTRRQSAWVGPPERGEAFFPALAARPDSPLKMFALKLNGSYFAAVLCLVSGNRLEYYSPTYAIGGEWERYSPGMLVTEDCGQWALRNGLDLDFRFTDFPYK
jgi:CelD/BcsL family acetyltransferase involved in cellulose biosynthesis